MKKTYTFFIISAMGSYAIKFLIDIVMFIYSIYGLGDVYYDDFYLFIPQMLSTLAMLVFYAMFFMRSFYGLLIKFFTVILVFVQIAFVIMLIYDRSLGYVFYFSVVAAVNFFNALFIKCNIIPLRDTGDFEYGPMIFELTSFVVMAVSVYSFFAAFPISFNHLVGYWEYYDVGSATKLNIVCEFVMILAYFACMRNNCKYIRDNTLDDDYFIEEIQ